MQKLLSIALASALFAPAAMAQTCLTTTFANNNNGAVGGQVFFDLTVASDVLVTSLETNFLDPVGTAVGLDMYTVPTTSIGNENNMAAWTLVASGTGTAAGAGVATPIAIGGSVLLPSGSYGVALIASGGAHAYTTGVFGASDAFLTIAPGGAVNVPWTGVPFSPRSWNGSICYTPAMGIFANFTADTQSGCSPLIVNFTDTTFDSGPGPISYAWDLDGDGTTDSTMQNPQFGYASGGVYNVSLTVASSSGTSTETKTGFIAVDILEAGFTVALVAGRTYQFTDATNCPATSYSWDLDNDGTVDSTSPNPVFTYPAPGIYTACLTVSNAQGMDTICQDVGVDIIPMPTFDRTFTSAALTRGYWFQTPVAFTMTSLECPDEGGQGMQNVAVYNMGAAPPVFNLSASTPPVFFAAGVPSGSPIPCCISFEAGDFVGVIGAAGDATTMQSSYGVTGNFASSVLGAPITLERFITQTNIVVTSGTGAYSANPNGPIGRVDTTVSAALAIEYGAATAGPSGMDSRLRCSSLAIPGTNLGLVLENEETGVVPFVLFGLGRGPVPIPGVGTLNMNMIVTSAPMSATPVNPGPVNYSFPVPNNPALIGGVVSTQSVTLGTGFSLTNGVEFTINL